MKIYLPTALVVAAAASQVGATDCGQVLRDPGFDLWCGDALCAWKTERGSVTRVPTWNEGDPGVQLDGSDTAIAQLSPVTDADGHCIEFDLIANIEPEAQVFLNVDLGDTGTDQQMEQLPSASWKPLAFLIALDGPYSGIRFELTKRGTGSAVLAQIQASIVDDMRCTGLVALAPGPQPDGAPCDDGSGCKSGLCADDPTAAPFLSPRACEGCAAASCGSDQVCGAGAPTSPVRAVPAECVALASAPLGAACLGGAECATGICAAGFCSTCAPDGDGSGGSGCAAGEACAREPSAIGPAVCAPARHRRQAGEPCAAGPDCSSGTCDGAPLQVCADGRACGNDTDCPFDGDSGSVSAEAFEQEPCLTVGVLGGSCR